MRGLLEYLRVSRIRCWMVRIVSVVVCGEVFRAVYPVLFCFGLLSSRDLKRCLSLSGKH